MEDRKASEAELWHEQVQRVKTYVHIVVTCPPSHNIGHIIKHYPAFATHVTIDYFQVRLFVDLLYCRKGNC